MTDGAPETAGQQELSQLSEEQKPLEETNPELKEKIAAQFAKLTMLLRAQLAAGGKQTENEWTGTEQAVYQRYKTEVMQEIRRQIDEQLTLRTGHLEEGPFKLEKVPQEKVKGRWLNDIAKEYGMELQALITLNQKMAQTESRKFHVVRHQNGKYYCWAEDKVYVKVAGVSPSEEEVGAASAVQPVMIASDEKDAALREYSGITALEEQREEAAEITSTREALLGTDRRGRARKEALEGTRLHKKDSIPVDGSIKDALDVNDWEKFKEAWKDVQGAGHIEDLFNSRLTFKAQGFHLRGYMEVLKKLQWSGADTTGKGAELQFKDVLKTVFPKGTGAETLILSIVQAQGNTIDTNSKFFKRFFRGLITDVSGNFLNSYDRILDEVKFTQSKPTAIGDGKAKVTLTLGQETLTLTAPIDQLVVLPEDENLYLERDLDPNHLERGDTAKVQQLLDQSTSIALFVSPEGQIRSGIGVIFEASQIEGNIAAAVAGKGQALALLQAMETIYKDTAELYEMTGELVYKEGTSDASGTDTELRADVEATGAEGTAFAATLESAFNTNQFEKRTREAKGLRTKKNQITYEDVESGVSYTMSKEELFKYFSGEGAMQEILDRFTHESFDEAGEKIVNFDEERAYEYLTNLFKAALLKNPDRMEELGIDTVEKAVKQFAVNFAKNELSPVEIQLLQEGFLLSMIQVHGKEVREGQEAQERTEAERQAITILFSDEFIASVFDAYELQAGQPLSSQDRQKISTALSVGFHMGFLRTIDEGATHTKVTEIYDAEGKLVQKETETIQTRKPGTKDAFKIDALSLGISPIHVTGLDPEGRGSFSLGFGGTVGINESAGEWGVGAGGRYQIDLTDSGLALYVDAGVGAGFEGESLRGVSPTVGGGIKIPVLLGILKMDLHGHAYLGGFETGVILGADTEKIYTIRLKNQLKKSEFAQIDQMLAEDKPNKAIAEAILSNPEFTGLKLPKVAQTLNATLELESGATIHDDPAFHQFVIDIYRAQRSEFAAKVLHNTSANPLYSLSIGAGIKVDSGVIKPQFHLGVTVYSRSLTYRTPTGHPYGDFSDARIAEKLRTGKDVDVTDMVLRGEIPQMQLDREGDPAFIKQGDSIAGILIGEQQLSEFNSKLHESGLHLSPREIVDARDAKNSDQRTLLELKVADVDGNLEVVIDPTLQGKVTLTYQNGTGSEPDHYFLAFAPGTNLTLKRQDFHYPYKKNGAYENTVITITENPLVSRGQLTELERVPVLRRLKGQRTVADYTHSDYTPAEGNLLELGIYFDKTADIPAAQRADWSRISEQDQRAREFMQAVGTIDYGEILDPTAQAQLTQEAKRLMDPTATDKNIIAFRKEFKQISLAGARYNPEKLRTVCAEKGKAVLGRDLTDGELNHFIQTLTIYSFIDIHGSGTDEELQKQKESYEKMLKGFMRDSLIREFDKLHDRNYAVTMADYVVSKLEITDPTAFNPEKGATLPEGGVFASIAGSERIVGIRINEGYRTQDLYKILQLTSFDLHSANAVERDVAKAIIGILNPLPKAVEVTAANAKALQPFLRDDFTLRMALVWAYKDAREHEALRDVIAAASNDNPQYLAAELETPARGIVDLIALVKAFQAFTLKAREAELSGAPTRIKVAEDVYLSFKDVRTSFFVFQRCGNVSLYLQEKILLENKVGQVITVMDESHRMVTPHGAEARLWVGAGAGFETQQVGEATAEEITETPPPEKEPEQPHQGGTGTEDEGEGETGTGGTGGEEGDDDAGTGPGGT